MFELLYSAYSKITQHFKTNDVVFVDDDDGGVGLNDQSIYIERTKNRHEVERVSSLLR